MEYFKNDKQVIFLIDSIKAMLPKSLPILRTTHHAFRMRFSTSSRLRIPILRTTPSECASQHRQGCGYQYYAPRLQNALPNIVKAADTNTTHHAFRMRFPTSSRLRIPILRTTPSECASQHRQGCGYQYYAPRLQNALPNIVKAADTNTTHHAFRMRFPTSSRLRIPILRTTPSECASQHRQGCGYQYYAPRLQNALPNIVKAADSVQHFKTQLNALLLKILVYMTKWTISICPLTILYSFENYSGKGAISNHFL